MRCDRVALMEAGRVLASDAPAALIAARGAQTLEEAFIAYLEEAGGTRRSAQEGAGLSIPAAAIRHAPMTRFSLQRLLAYSRREGLELLRDPIRLGFALLGTAFLMLIFGFGITTDVDSLSFAVLDRDHTPESRAYIEEFSGSRYFQEKPPLADYADLERRLRTGQISASIEIPPGFGRDVRGGRPTEIGAWVDGAMPFRAETIRQYLQGVHAQYLADVAASLGARAIPAAATIAPRFRYNQDFDSINAMVPSTIALMLMLFPAILMALAVVREKELGSIVNLYVTPVRRLEFLLGKQLPYIALALVNFVALFLMAVLIFAVPFKGSFGTLALGAAFYVGSATAYGMLISAFTRTQIAALFGTAILTMVPAITFSGMLSPVSSLEGMAAITARGFPMTYFLHVSVGTFTKGLGFYDLRTDILALILFVPVLLLLATLLLRKQER